MDIPTPKEALLSSLAFLLLLVRLAALFEVLLEKS